MPINKDYNFKEFLERVSRSTNKNKPFIKFWKKTTIIYCKYKIRILLQVSLYLCLDLIKRFFSTLKIPVFPFASFMELMNDAEVHDKISHLKSVYDAMPELNKTTLTFIFYFFKEKLLKYEHLNKMNAQNIAICFAPCIFRS